jgi:hypothetical protein
MKNIFPFTTFVLILIPLCSFAQSKNENKGHVPNSPIVVTPPNPYNSTNDATSVGGEPVKSVKVKKQKLKEKKTEPVSKPKPKAPLRVQKKVQNKFQNNNDSLDRSHAMMVVSAKSLKKMFRKKHRFFLELGFGYGDCNADGDYCDDTEGSININTSVFSWLTERFALGLTWHYQRFTAERTEDDDRYENTTTSRNMGIEGRVFTSQSDSIFNFYLGFGLGFGEGKFRTIHSWSTSWDGEKSEVYSSDDDFEYFSLSLGALFLITKNTSAGIVVRYQNNDWDTLEENMHFLSIAFTISHRLY